MAQWERVRLPGDRGDLVSGGERLVGEQAAGGAVGPEDCDTHDGCPSSVMSEFLWCCSFRSW
jgi:hypothetical protein